MRINLDLEDTYKIEYSNPELTEFAFNSPVTGGGIVEVMVRIQLVKDEFLKEYFNLAFGPLIEKDGKAVIDDFASVQHINPSKVFSTVLLCGLSYLRANPGSFLGIGGSDFRRAYLYYRIIQKNFSYLEEFFRLAGAKFFIRVILGKNKYSSDLDSEELMYTSNVMEKVPLTKHKSLFNVFLLYLK